MEVEELKYNINSVLAEKQIHFEVKKMFGGLCFMVDNKMCFGIYKPKNKEQPMLIARVGEHFYKSALRQPFCSEFNLTGKPMKGFVFIENRGIDNFENLKYWVEKCLDYIPLIKKSKLSNKLLNNN